MPRYHFHVCDGVDRPDPIGTELPGITAARGEALKRAGRIIEDADQRADLGEEWHITATDGAGLTLFTMDFYVAEAPAVRGRMSEAASPPPRPPSSMER